MPIGAPAFGEQVDDIACAYEGAGSNSQTASNAQVAATFELQQKRRNRLSASTNMSSPFGWFCCDSKLFGEMLARRYAIKSRNIPE